MQYLIRPAKPEDLPALRLLLQQLHPTDPMPPVEQLRAPWTAMLANPAIHCLVGEDGTHIVSTCTLVITQNLTHSARPFAFIENVVTHQDHRRQGWGTALLKAALAIAWQAGGYKVMLMTGSRRPETHQFYKNAGFADDEKFAFIARPK
jgi:GNAT superfamily N-acetyltransferase